VVFAAGGITIALANDPSAAAPGAQRPSQHAAKDPAKNPVKDPAKDPAKDPPADPTALAAAQLTRDHAAAWIAAQVSHGVVVGCDPAMCTALQQHGFPAANLDALGPNAADPLGTGVIADTAALRSQFGSRLATVYAPEVIASFGTGQSLIEVRVTFPGGATAYQAEIHADLLSRQTGGRDLLQNSHVQLTQTARTQLADGQVDVRLLMTLAALAHRLPVEVQQFADAGPGAAPGTPLRSVEIALDIKVGRNSRASYQQSVVTFLRAQRSLLRANLTVRSAGSRPVLWIEFSAPSPLGLLPGTRTQN